MQILKNKLTASQYWDDQWKDRIQFNDREVFFNNNKRRKIVQFMKQFNLKGLKKLELGCGIGQFNFEFDWDNYIGIDLSQRCVDFGNHYKPNSKYLCMDVIDFNPDGFFDVFLAFDSLEHIELTDKLAEKINSLSKESSLFIGNVPLAASAHEEEFEHDMSYEILSDFLRRAGFPTLHTISLNDEAIMVEKNPRNGLSIEKGKVYLPYLLFYAQRHL